MSRRWKTTRGRSSKGSPDSSAKWRTSSLERQFDFEPGMCCAAPREGRRRRRAANDLAGCDAHHAAGLAYLPGRRSRQRAVSGSHRANVRQLAAQLGSASIRAGNEQTARARARLPARPCAGPAEPARAEILIAPDRWREKRRTRLRFGPHHRAARHRARESPCRFRGRRGIAPRQGWLTLDPPLAESALQPCSGQRRLSAPQATRSIAACFIGRVSASGGDGKSMGSLPAPSATRTAECH